MKKILYLVIPIVIVIIGYSMLSGSSEDYINQIQARRQEQITYLKTADDSPFNRFDVPFEEPKYFPVSTDYRVRANLERFSKTERVILQTSDGVTKSFIKFAYAKFKLQGEAHQLLILKPTGFGADEHYFLGFADETSGASTYGGGRYIDLEIGKSDNITIDFNMAYNPYCAYTTGYSCPIPPAENILPIGIEAGEMDYKH
ncbi:DUF1684 domain-containing protein [Marinoscillum sp. MHG1-6]|uniref:DUF1684 domain-containing protein n=1 Tax=Marinoscillum sp. MHG1-6 TaxID=2959627 RepID=UPI002157CB4B|nr:DUF1684 domain-containing protein [Marinoscillum sp. MHG1-6]